MQLSRNKPPGIFPVLPLFYPCFPENFPLFYPCPAHPKMSPNAPKQAKTAPLQIVCL